MKVIPLNLDVHDFEEFKEHYGERSLSGFVRIAMKNANKRARLEFFIHCACGANYSMRLIAKNYFREGEICFMGICACGAKFASVSKDAEQEYANAVKSQKRILGQTIEAKA